MRLILPAVLPGRIAVAAMVVMCPATLFAQPQTPRMAAGCSLADPVKFHACAVEKMKTFTPPRTAEGVPDMQGYWGRAYTSQDIEEHKGDAFNIVPGPSIVLDTPDRRIPYQPWAAELRKTMVATYISPLAACYPPGVPRFVVAPAAHQILQTPGYFVHLFESSHSYRVIPTTARPHAPAAVKLYSADSRGRWEGNTLVVDVTNSNGQTWIDNAGNFFSDAIHVTERFTMVDSDTIHYEGRIEDPKVYTRPWTMVSALLRNKEKRFELFEQACHEGNRSVEGSESIGMQRYRGITLPAGR